MKVFIRKFSQNNFFRDSFWALLGSVVLRGASLISSIMLAHIMQKTVYGEFNSLKNTLTTLAIFTTFGLGYTGTKFVADYIFLGSKNLRALVNRIYKITFVFSGTISFLLFVFSKKVSFFYYKNTEFSDEIRLLALWVVLTAISTSQNGIIGGLGIFKKLSFVNIFMGIITILILPIFAYFFGLIGACVGLLFIQFVNCILYFVYIKKELSSIKDTSVENVPKSSYKNILFFSTPLTLVEASFSIFLWLNYYLLQNFQNYDEVAIYSAAMQWYIVLLFIPTVLRNVILSYFSKNKETSKNIVFRNALLISLVSTFFPAVILYFLAPFITALYGTSFHELTSVLRIVIFIPVFSGIMNVLEQFLFSVSKNWLVFFICFFKDSFTFIIFGYSIFFLDVKHGALFLTLSYLIMNIISSLIYAYIYFRTNIFKEYLIQLKN